MDYEVQLSPLLSRWGFSQFCYHWGLEERAVEGVAPLPLTPFSFLPPRPHSSRAGLQVLVTTQQAPYWRRLVKYQATDLQN